MPDRIIQPARELGIPVADQESVPMIAGNGLNRCRYKGLPGMKRWVGLGVIGDNLINIGQALAHASDT